MFFTKPTTQSNSSQPQVVIIGTSAQAFFIADLLQNAKCTVTILISEKQKDKQSKNVTLTLRPSGFQNRRTEFTFSTQAPENIAFIFVASKPEDIKNDILLLNSLSHKNIPIINLSFFYNTKELNLLNHIKNFPAFMDGQFIFEKNILTFVGRPEKIEICAPTETVNELKNLINGNLNVIKITAQKNLFWQNFIPIYLASLIITSQNQNISTSLNHSHTRHLVDSALQELSCFAKKQKADFDTTAIITKLYGFSDNYRGELTNKQNLNTFSGIFPQINKFDTPALFELWTMVLKKY